MIIEKYFFLATVQSCPEVNLQTVLTVNWSLDSLGMTRFIIYIIYSTRRKFNLRVEKIQIRPW